MQVRSLAVTPNGALLTGSRDKTIKLWREGPDGAFHEESTLVSAVQLTPCWQWQQWRRRRRRQSVRICRLPPARLLLRGHTRTGCCAVSRSLFAPLPPQVGHTDFVSALAYAPPGVLPGCPGGAVVSGSRDCTVIVWDLASAEPVQKLEGHQYQVGAGRGVGQQAGRQVEAREGNAGERAASTAWRWCRQPADAAAATRRPLPCAPLSSCRSAPCW